jgi:hypothetical protein
MGDGESRGSAGAPAARSAPAARPAAQKSSTGFDDMDDVIPC